MKHTEDITITTVTFADCGQCFNSIGIDENGTVIESDGPIELWRNFNICNPLEIITGSRVGFTTPQGEGDYIDYTVKKVTREKRDASTVRHILNTVVHTNRSIH